MTTAILQQNLLTEVGAIISDDKMVEKATNYIVRMRARAAEKEAAKLARRRQQEEEFRASFTRAIDELREHERTGKPLQTLDDFLKELEEEDE